MAKDMDDIDNPFQPRFQQLEAAKKQLIIEFKENAKSAQELEFWTRMEIVRDNYTHLQEDSSFGDTTDEGENLNKDKKTDDKVPDTASDNEEITQKKSAAGENADEEKGLKKEHTVTFHIPKKEHGAGDDTPVHKKDFIFQNDGMEHDFNHNATSESLNSFENEDDNELRALQMTEDKLEINETDNKKVSAEKINDYKVGIKELFKAAKKREKMEAKESEKKRKLKENESKKKGKMEAREIERKMEAQESKEKKAREEKKIKKKRKIDKKKAENQKKYEKCIAKGETQKRKEEFKSSQKKHQSEVSESKQKTPKLMDFVRSLVGCIRNRH